MSDFWNEVYTTRSVSQRSWSEDEPTVSLDLLDALGVGPGQSVIDIGAGESQFVDHLRRRGYGDLSILDVSRTALRATADRVGNEHLTLIEADVTSWRPTRRYDLWHDRAVLHFLSPLDAERYAATLREALLPGGAVVIGVFSPDGPDSCSGLPVTRYSHVQLQHLLGEEFLVVSERRELHHTPWGNEQSFQWIAARRQEEA